MQNSSVPEFIDPVFTKTSPKRSFSLNRKRAFWLVFAKTGSIILGTGVGVRSTRYGSKLLGADRSDLRHCSTETMFHPHRLSVLGPGSRLFYSYITHFHRASLFFLSLFLTFNSFYKKIKKITVM